MVGVNGTIKPHCNWVSVYMSTISNLMWLKRPLIKDTGSHTITSTQKLPSLLVWQRTKHSCKQTNQLHNEHCIYKHLVLMHHRSQLSSEAEELDQASNTGTQHITATLNIKNSYTVPKKCHYAVASVKQTSTDSWSKYYHPLNAEKLATCSTPEEWH